MKFRNKIFESTFAAPGEAESGAAALSCRNRVQGAGKRIF